MPTFEICVQALIESKRSGWRNAKHAQQWENTLRSYAFPLIGKKHPEDITLADLKAILLPLWSTKTETATWLRLAAPPDGQVPEIMAALREKPSLLPGSGVRTGLGPCE